MFLFTNNTSCIHNLNIDPQNLMKFTGKKIPGMEFMLSLQSIYQL